MREAALDEFEAMDVLFYLLCTFAPGCGRLYRLGNGEWCIKMRWHDWFVWTWRDTVLFLQLMEDQGYALDEKRRATRHRNKERVAV
jgi:hypothetical protein